MKLCQKCVLPLQNGNELCHTCNDYTPEKIDWDAKEFEFGQMVDAFRGKGEKYDFMVPLTGGKDSSFVLYYMTKVLKTRTLAYTWDNGLIRKQAWENINNAVKQTGVDHQIFKWDPKILQTFFKATLKTLGKVCFCPVLLTLNALPNAIENKIPLIITGFSEGQREMDHCFKLPDQAVHKKKCIEFYHIWHTAYSGAVNRSDPENKDKIINHMFEKAKTHLQPDSKVDFYPVMVPLSNYINWTDSVSLQNTLKAIGYKKAADATAHTSCMIEPIKGFIEHRRGLTEIASEISYMIRSNAMSREDGLKDFKKMCLDGNVSDESITWFCEFLNISRDEFYKYTSPENKAPAGANNPVETKVDTLAWIMGIGKVSAAFV